MNTFLDMIRYNFEIFICLISIIILSVLIVYGLKRRKLKRIIVTFLVSIILLEMTLHGTAIVYYTVRNKFSNIPTIKEDNTFRILCIGESTTFGSGVNQNDAYPVRLEKMLKDEYPKLGIKVYNHGIPGCTSTSIFRGIDYDLLVYKPHLVIVLLGSNDYTLANCGINSIKFWKFDLSFLKKSKTYKIIRVVTDLINPWTHNMQYGYRTYIFPTPEEGHIDVMNCPPPSMAQWNIPTAYTIQQSEHITQQFSYNMEQITNKVRKQNGKVYFTGYLHLKDIDRLISEVAKSNNVLYIDQLLKEEEKGERLFVEDNWHLNERGHNLMAKKLFEVIKKEKIIENFMEY